jgi:hypothetical protein
VDKNNRGKAAAAVEIPSELDSEEFCTAWGEWLQHRKEIKKPATPTAQQKQLSKLATMGPARAVAALNHSIGNGWTGIFEPNGESRNGSTKRLSNGPGQRHPDDAGRAEF